MASPAYEMGVDAALEKFAATRGLKEVRSAIMAGNWGRANTLSKTPGVLRRGNIYGSQLADLGAGGEGLATLVAHPKHGISVRKTYDPAGSVYSPEIIRRKEQLGSLPGAADYYGKSISRQNTPVHFNEFVRGEDVNALSLGQAGAGNAYMKTLMQLRRAGRQQGYNLADLRGANARLTPDGRVKFIDHMPLTPVETESNRLMRHFRRRGAGNLLSSTPEAAAKLFPRQADAFTQQGATAQQNPALFKHLMFSGKPMPTAAMPTVRQGLQGTATVNIRGGQPPPSVYPTLPPGDFL